MKLVVQAVQAVTMELIGVLLVIWMLFGFASWGLQSAAETTSNRDRKVSEVLGIWTARWTETVSSPRPRESERTAYVAERLDHYGQLFSMASKNLVSDLIQGGEARQESMTTSTIRHETGWLRSR